MFGSPTSQAILIIQLHQLYHYSLLIEVCTLIEKYHSFPISLSLPLMFPMTHLLTITHDQFQRHAPIPITNGQLRQPPRMSNSGNNYHWQHALITTSNNHLLQSSSSTTFDILLHHVTTNFSKFFKFLFLIIPVFPNLYVHTKHIFP